MQGLLADMERELQALAVTDATVAAARGAALAAVTQLRSATLALLQLLATRPDVGMGVAVPYLKLCGYVIGGWLLVKSGAVAADKLDSADRTFYAAKIRTAAFYAAQVLPNAAALAQVVIAGGTSVTETDAALI